MFADIKKAHVELQSHYQELQVGEGAVAVLVHSTFPSQKSTGEYFQLLGLESARAGGKKGGRTIKADPAQAAAEEAPSKSEKKARAVLKRAVSNASRYRLYTVDHTADTQEERFQLPMLLYYTVSRELAGAPCNLCTALLPPPAKPPT